MGISLGQAAKILGVSSVTVFRWGRIGKIKAQSIPMMGGRHAWIYDQRSVRALAKQRAKTLCR
jgi:predicted site-specific integrase-resolvase